MSQAPRDRSEFWVRFVCAFLFFGGILALGGIGLHVLLEGESFTQAAILWSAATLGCSIYAAKVGDDAWRKILDVIRWWP